MARTIIDKLADTLHRKELGVGGSFLSFVYADEGLQNIILEGADMPFAAVVPITSSAVVADDGRYHERLTVAVFFGDSMQDTGSDYDGVENERIIDTCKQRAFLWLTSLNLPSEYKELRLIAVTRAERGYLKLDGNYTGFAVVVTLEEISGVGMCEWREALIPDYWKVEFDNHLWIGGGITEIDGHTFNLQTRADNCYFGGDLTRGTQIGSRKQSADVFELYISGFDTSREIERVEIESCCGNNTQAVINYVGGDYDSYEPQDVTLDGQVTKYTFYNRWHDMSGSVAIYCIQCSAAVWIKSISVIFKEK